MTQNPADDSQQHGHDIPADDAAPSTPPAHPAEPALPSYGTPPAYGEPPVYGSPAPGGPPPAPPPPPPGYGPPGSPAHGQPPPPAPSQWGQSTPPGGSFPGSGGRLTWQEERQWAMLAHLGGVLAIFPLLALLPSVIIYSIYQARGEFVRDQAREALNFQISVLIAYVVARILGALPLIPGNLVVLVWIFSLIFSIVAAVTANKGQNFRYPITFRFMT